MAEVLETQSPVIRFHNAGAEWFRRTVVATIEEKAKLADEAGPTDVDAKRHARRLHELWRVRVTHSAAGAHTYSVSCSLP
jgi:hypothetical protein